MVFWWYFSGMFGGALMVFWWCFGGALVVCLVVL